MDMYHLNKHGTGYNSIKLTGMLSCVIKIEIAIIILYICIINMCSDVN